MVKFTRDSPPSIHDLLLAHRGDVDAPLHSRFDLIRDRLLRDYQTRWCMRWADGNDHGPGHIERVLLNLIQLLGTEAEMDPIAAGRIRPHELFLVATAAVAHDIGVVQGREDHAQSSAMLLADIAKSNDIVFDETSLPVLEFAISCHSSSVDIEKEAERLQITNDTFFLGTRVRPKRIAALVRLADELDEDKRRAPSAVQRHVQISGPSAPYWQFCQKVDGVWIDDSDIRFDVTFEPDDLSRSVMLSNKNGARNHKFLDFFGEKLAKINRERGRVISYLQELARKRILVNVRVRGSSGAPMELVFSDAHASSDSGTQDAARHFTGQLGSARAPVAVAKHAARSADSARPTTAENREAHFPAPEALPLVKTRSSTPTDPVAILFGDDPVSSFNLLQSLQGDGPAFEHVWSTYQGRPSSHLAYARMLELCARLPAYAAPLAALVRGYKSGPSWFETLFACRCLGATGDRHTEYQMTAEIMAPAGLSMDQLRLRITTLGWLRRNSIAQTVVELAKSDDYAQEKLTPYTLEYLSRLMAGSRADSARPYGDAGDVERFTRFASWALARADEPYNPIGRNTNIGAHSYCFAHPVSKANAGIILSLWLRDQRPEFRLWGAQALGLTRFRRAIPDLARILADPGEDARVRQSAAHALVSIGTDQAYESMTGALPDWEDGIRMRLSSGAPVGTASVAHFLAVCMRTRYVEVLELAIDSMQLWPRMAAALGLAKLTGPLAVNRLVDLDHDAEPGVEKMITTAALVLAGHGAAEGPLLQAVMQVPSNWVGEFYARYILEALRSISNGKVYADRYEELRDVY